MCLRAAEWVIRQPPIFQWWSLSFDQALEELENVLFVVRCCVDYEEIMHSFFLSVRRLVRCLRLSRLVTSNRRAIQSSVLCPWLPWNSNHLDVHSYRLTFRLSWPFNCVSYAFLYNYSKILKSYSSIISMSKNGLGIPMAFDCPFLPWFCGLVLGRVVSSPFLPLDTSGFFVPDG